MESHLPSVAEWICWCLAHTVPTSNSINWVTNPSDTEVEDNDDDLDLEVRP